MRSLTESFGKGQRGFTLIELLVTVAILGVLAAVAVPAVSSFVVSADNNAKEIELRDVQSAVGACLAAAGASKLNADTILPASDGSYENQSEMDEVTATGPNGTFNVAMYMSGLDAGGAVHIGQTYNIALDGTVTLYVAP